MLLGQTAKGICSMHIYGLIQWDIYSGILYSGTLACSAAAASSILDLRKVARLDGKVRHEVIGKDYVY
jgi:hypothetical protein